ncbi:DUF6475 domain-containing protein [Chitinimonas naiadis]
MQQSDAAQFRQLLADVMGFYRQDVSQFTANVWWQAMKPFEFQAVADAFNRHCIDADRGQWAPKPADVVRLLQGGSKDGAAVAWAKVDRAVRCVGPHRSVVFDDAIIHACIADMGGWTAFATVTLDEYPFLANKFQTLYQGYRQRPQLPPFPPVLIGFCEAENGMEGRKSESPMLLGEPEKARYVMLSGSDKAGLQVTRLTDHMAAANVALLPNQREEVAA